MPAGKAKSHRASKTPPKSPPKSPARSADKAAARRGGKAALARRADAHTAGISEVVDIVGAVFLIGWLEGACDEIGLRVLAHGTDRVADLSDRVVLGPDDTAGDQPDPSGRRSFAALIDDTDSRRGGDPARYSVRIAVADFGVSADDLTPRRFDVRDLLDDPNTTLLHACLLKAGRLDVAGIIGRTVSGADPGTLRHSIEASVRAGAASVVAGWIADLQTRRICIVDSNLRACAGAGDGADRMVVRSRPDIHTALQAEGHRTRGGDGHGFIGVLEEAHGCGESFYFAETDPRSGHVAFFGPFDKPVIADDTVAADLVSAPFGDVFSTPPDLAEKLFRPIVERPDQALMAERFVYDAAGSGGEEPPVHSIIIPFYGDAFFLSCVFHLDRLLDRRFEIVIVVDDPELWPQIKSAFDRRRTAIRTRTVLLRNRENYGYANANNLGARAASGSVLILMNSDIFVSNIEALRRAGARILKAAEQGRDLILGFLLLYEDKSVQHIGMEFVRAPSVSDLYIAQHPMKGLPLDLVESRKDRSVAAATGALLAISADQFRRLGGFDPAYLRGDFEDADLCLRARAAGATIKVLFEPGLYHLERQSFSQMTGDALRRMITYVNCITFNRRWGEELSGPGKPARRRTRRIVSSRSGGASARRHVD